VYSLEPVIEDHRHWRSSDGGAFGVTRKRRAVDDSIDHLNYLARSWINQNGVVIDDCVAVGWGNAVFPRHSVKDYPGGRQDHSHLRISL
jgi:hypothetical protein